MGVYLQYNSPNKKGLSSIKFMVSYDSKDLPIGAGISVDLKYFDKKVKEATKEHPNYKIINSQLKAKIALLERLLLEAKSFQPNDVLGYVSEKYKEFTDINIGNDKVIPLNPEPDFFKIMDIFIDSLRTKISTQTKKLISRNTIASFVSLKNMLLEFQHHHKASLTFGMFDNDFYRIFEKYQVSEKGNNANTLGKYIKRLKQFLSWSEDYFEDHNIEVRMPRKWKKYAAPSKYRGVAYLTPDELDMLYRYECPSKELQRSLDLFLAMCYTGFHHGDLMDLKDSEIQSHAQMIIKNRGKTDFTCYVPFMDDQIFHICALTEKYKGQRPGFVFPRVSNDKVNENLQRIQELLSFDRIKITTKVGRKTFVTVKLVYMKVPKLDVMAATGHQTEKEFNRYAGVDILKIRDSFREHRQHLKKV